MKRIEAAEVYLKRDLNIREQEAIVKAHNI
jgi:hypothetical protein